MYPGKICLHDTSKEKFGEYQPRLQFGKTSILISDSHSNLKYKKLVRPRGTVVQWANVLIHDKHCQGTGNEIPVEDKNLMCFSEIQILDEQKKLFAIGQPTLKTSQLNQTWVNNLSTQYCSKFIPNYSVICGEIRGQIRNINGAFSLAQILILFKYQKNRIS